MRFPELDHYFTGVLVPVASLRSAESAGIGEFSDLVPLGDWCRSVGLDMIQILPVNDTGFDSSPYSAVSAFGLHPVYLRLQELPELEQTADPESYRERIREMQRDLNGLQRIAYQDVLRQKMRLLRDLYEETEPSIRADNALRQWVGQNPWVKAYAVFRTIGERHEHRSWVEWGSMRNPSLSEIERQWNNDTIPGVMWFYAWLQFRLEEQLRAAVQHLEKLGVYLKGDLPILMNEDSADVWAHRDIFIPELRAGAPPDMFSELGQNWNFPVYDWDRLAERDYDWWKRRLQQADKFYHAYRIDHVLGFFRIWAIPSHDDSGTMGFFYPSALISAERLQAEGFDEGRVRWLAEPHISREELERQLGDRADVVAAECLRQLDSEPLYVFAASVRGERDLQALGLPERERGVLLEWYRDRVFLEVEGGTFALRWDFETCSRYGDLSEEERGRLKALDRETREQSEEMWEEQGRRLLSFMNSTAPMLTCAEDLGVIPESVPRTLADLGILGMRVPRWAREWDEPEQPFVPPEEYSFLTVCAPSVHDTSTLREWWETEGPVQPFWETLGLSGEAPQRYGPGVAEQVLRAILRTHSAICMLQIQDLFALDGELVADDPVQDRVNVPGTYNSWNWSYRVPLRIEKLRERSSWNAKIQELVLERRRRQP
jgi:4-alpha-glucanotransferase